MEKQFSKFSNQLFFFFWGGGGGGNVDAFTLERHSITNSFKPEIDPFFLRAAGQ